MAAEQINAQAVSIKKTDLSYFPLNDLRQAVEEVNRRNGE